MMQQKKKQSRWQDNTDSLWGILFKSEVIPTSLFFVKRVEYKYTVVIPLVPTPISRMVSWTLSTTWTLSTMFTY